MNTAAKVDRNQENSTAGTIHSVAERLSGARIIIADENPESADDIKKLFKQLNTPTQMHRASSVEDLQQSLQDADWDIVIGFSYSTQFLPAVINKKIEQAAYPTRSIFVDANFSATNAAQIIQCGFSDYLVKGENERLIFAVAREVEAVRNGIVALSSQEVLAEANAKSELLLNSTADAIAYISDGMLIDVNKPFVDSLGYTDAEELELQPLIDLVAESHQDEIRRIIKQMSVDADQIDSATIALTSADGKEPLFQFEFAAASHEGEPCTQLIVRPIHGESTATASNATPSAPPSVSAATTHPQPSLDQLRALEGKGLMTCIAIGKLDQLRQSIDITQYLELLEQLHVALIASLPAKSVSTQFLGEYWIVGKRFDDEVDAHQFAETIANDINTQIQSVFPANSQVQAAIGVTKFGVAGIETSEAIDKAFNLCAEIQTSGGGTRVFAPRIDNAEGSAALKSAMELDRLKVKYLPTIGLQNQTEKNYEVCIFLRNDAGQEQWATEFTESLGLEKENVALDQWVVNQVLAELAVATVDAPNICVTIPLTASAIVDDEFSNWLINTLKSSGLQRDNFAFCITSDHAGNYSSQATSLFSHLSELGFKTGISNIGSDNFSLIKEIKPTFAQLSGELTQNLNADEETNSRATFKQLVQETAGSPTKCIATAVNTAAELAQLWQSGVPFVQGDYLQTPLTAMNYEFSDIA